MRRHLLSLETGFEKAWVTPTEHVFSVGHYGIPAELDASRWHLKIAGLVDKPASIDLAALKSRPRVERTVTIECAGNGPGGGMIANARWAGTPLAPLLQACGVRAEAIEAVLFAHDRGTKKIRGGDYPQHFARSLLAGDAMRSDVLLA